MEISNIKQEKNNIEIMSEELSDSFIQTGKNKKMLKSRRYNCCQLILYFFLPFLKKIDTVNKRIVDINDTTSNYTFFQNKIKNQKYNILTFFPRVLLNQFSYFSNQFYLLMVISQFFDALKVGFLFSYVAPLVFVLFVTLVKEAIDDIYRFRQDKITNLQKFTKVFLEKKSNSIKKKLIKSQDIQIGDILEINQNERIPADMVILKTFDESGSLFIRTDQLDGETDWKLRKAPGLTQSLPTFERLFDLKGNIEYDPPSKMIYEFTGVLNFYDENFCENNLDSISSDDNFCKEKGKISNMKNKKNSKNSSGHKKEALGLENTMWASTILASKKALGIVIYTGKEARFQMNSSEPKTKKGALDEEINYLSKILFFIMLISSIIITLLKGFRTSPITMLLDFSRFIVLLCAIIPISLAVNLDISKTVNSMNISRDERIPETIARNSTIPEELGRIEYIFSDKTGTLTKNEMLFKRISMENDTFGIESFNDLKLIIEDECKKFDAPAMDIINIYDNINYNNINNSLDENSMNSESILNKDNKLNQNSQKRIRRNRNKIIRDTVTAMALCNNVTPILDEENDPNSKKDFIEVSLNSKEEENLMKKNINLSIIKSQENDKGMKNSELLNSEKENKLHSENDVIKSNKINYQASSPDEVALVKIAEELNVTLIDRNDKEIKIKNSNDFIEEFEILANFPFSSDTKRMGILLRNKKHGHILFYLKGAESVIEKFVKEEYKAYIRENAENLAVIGLRTLVLTQKIISKEFYENWNEEYIEAKTSLENRKEKVMEVMSKLEKNMDFLAVTGVEDLLQDDVCNTIESLRNAGIKIWMLTGDKVETATCISISAGLKNKADKLFFIKEKAKEENYVINELNKIEYNISQTVLVIDGDCLEVALNNHEKEFFEIAMMAPSVVCCRCSPTQKAKITQKIKNYTNKRTCSIGDGGNDVAMIQQADVGIGLVGKEGLQASLAADFSITKFKHLSHLLLWHGRLSYKNTATIAKFVIHRGLIISLIQFIFSIIFYNLAVPIYNGMLILGYSTIYTSLPVISLLLDEDTKVKNVMKFPALYKNLLKGRELSIKAFLWWCWKSIFQAAVIMIGAVLFFDKIFLKIATITFTVLIFAELLNVYSEVFFYLFLDKNFSSLYGYFAIRDFGYLYTFDNIF